MGKSYIDNHYHSKKGRDIKIKKCNAIELARPLRATPYRGLAARKNGTRLCGNVGMATFGGAVYFISERSRYNPINKEIY
jgi:hypothetical protein